MPVVPFLFACVGISSLHMLQIAIQSFSPYSFTNSCLVAHFHTSLVFLLLPPGGLLVAPELSIPAALSNSVSSSSSELFCVGLLGGGGGGGGGGIFVSGLEIGQVGECVLHEADWLSILKLENTK
ncbi:hypothetical protein LguiA_022638 [Lonicera macranthoides]